jgi:outer membrane lipoprotein-sorting protein
MRRNLFLLAVLCGWVASPAGLVADANSLVDSWLAAQTNIHTWSAEVVQTRTFKSLAQPLQSTGRVWFAAPDRFRWELGNPPQTIAARGEAELLIVYPRLKRVERFPLAANLAGPWRDAMALLETGFPRSRAELEARYQQVGASVTGARCELVFQPRSASARRLIPRIQIEFNTGTFSLEATELQFADQSTMRNEFRNPQVNPKLEDSLFTPEIPSDYRVVEPLKK